MAPRVQTLRECDPRQDDLSTFASQGATLEHDTPTHQTPSHVALVQVIYSNDTVALGKRLEGKSFFADAACLLLVGFSNVQLTIKHNCVAVVVVFCAN